MVQVPSPSVTVSSLDKQDSNLKASRGMHLLVKRAVISSNALKTMGETTYVTEATGVLMPEQEEFQGPMKAWLIEKCQVLAK